MEYEIAGIMFWMSSFCEGFRSLLGSGEVKNGVSVSGRVWVDVYLAIGVRLFWSYKELGSESSPSAMSWNNAASSTTSISGGGDILPAIFIAIFLTLWTRFLSVKVQLMPYPRG